MNWKEIEQSITGATSSLFVVEKASSVGGGCINSAYRVEGYNQTYFIKLNKPNSLPMFEAEFTGLEEMGQSQSVRIPEGIVSGKTSNHSFLVLEFIETGTPGKNSARLLGRQLAQMHLLKQPHFGWHRENTIGSTPQINDASDDWVSFWKEQRLGFQLKLAADNGYGGRLQQTSERLCCGLDAFFSTYRPRPSLLHGDLWGGNASVDTNGQPFIYDPACYYGDFEADLAMTELFGGFSRDFYSAYDEINPRDADYTIRKELYNVYHILNHLNLFGSSYLGQAQNLIDRLLSEI